MSDSKARAARAYASECWSLLLWRGYDCFIDTAAAFHEVLMRLWLALLSLCTVWADPTGRARQPIPVHIGRARTPGIVCLMTAATPFQLRLIAHFWRNPHEPTCQRLLALVTRYGGNPSTPID
ncbi:hypothetical protein ElyMa_002541900, partial [Elysia marginata]